MTIRVNSGIEEAAAREGERMARERQYMNMLLGRADTGSCKMARRALERMGLSAIRMSSSEVTVSSW